MAFGALGRGFSQAGIAVRPPVVASGAPANTVAPAVTPVGPSASGTLLTTTQGTWTNTPLSYTYQWRADGANVGTNATTYTTQTADLGKLIDCLVTATNASGSGQRASNTHICGGVPAISVAPVITGSGWSGDVHTVNTGTWTNGPQAYTYRWNRDGSPILFATASSYTPVVDDEGTNLTCTVTASNTHGAGTASTTAAKAITSGVPIVSVAPVVTGDTIVGGVLSCGTGTWSNTPTSYVYQWRRNGAGISGETANTYTKVVADAGQSINCLVTAVNAKGSSTPSNSNAIVVQSAPANTGAPVLSGTAVIDATLTTTNGTWSNSPTSYVYEFYSDGVLVQSSDVDPTYVVDGTDLNKTIQAKVSATNASGTSAFFNSNSIAIPGTSVPVNTVPPVLSGATGGYVAAGKAVTCTSGTWTNSPSSYSYQFLADATVRQTSSSNSYTTTEADAGKVISCKVTANNGAFSGTVVSDAFPGTGALESPWIEETVYGSFFIENGYARVNDNANEGGAIWGFYAGDFTTNDRFAKATLTFVTQVSGGGGGPAMYVPGGGGDGYAVYINNDNGWLISRQANGTGTTIATGSVAGALALVSGDVVTLRVKWTGSTNEITISRNAGEVMASVSDALYPANTLSPGMYAYHTTTTDFRFYSWSGGDYDDGGAILFAAGDSLPATSNTFPCFDAANLLLHFGGADASTVFTDSSQTAHTVTKFGNAQIDTAQSVFGGSAGLFDGSGDYLTTDGSAEFAFGTGDFTIEFRLRPNASSQYALIDWRPTSTPTHVSPTIYLSSGNILKYFTNGADRITGPNIPAGAWKHIALCRVSGTTRMFVDGTQVGSSYTDANNYLVGASRPAIVSMGEALGDIPLNGWIDELRIIKGYGRWSANFTVPTAAYSPAPPPTLPQTWTNIPNNTDVVENGITWRAQTNAAFATAIQHDIPNKVWRFNLRPGDHPSFDGASVDRCEMSQNMTLIAPGTESWLSYAVRWNTAFSGASYTVMGQFHHSMTTLSPPFGNNFAASGTQRGERRFSTANPIGSNPSPQVEWTNAAYTRGGWHRYVIRAKTGPTGNGILDVYEDGVKLTARAAGGLVAFGYTQSTGEYWKFGDYRGSGPSITDCVDYCNVEVAADLSARILTPLAIPIIPYP